MSKPPLDIDRRYRLFVLALTVVAVTIPFLGITIPPSTDAAQHVAQMRLLESALESPDGSLAIQWATPYWLGYGVVAIWWNLVSPMVVAKWSIWTLGLLWAVALHGLAWRYDRSVAGATLASMLFFTESVYWGYLPFLAGFPIFAVWYVATVESREWPPALEFLVLAGVSGLLYFTHALWWAAAVGWLAVHTLLYRRSWRSAAARAAAILPPLVHALVWFPTLESKGFVSETTWVTAPTGRLSLRWLNEHTFGTIAGFVPALCVVLLFAWIAASLFQLSDLKLESPPSAPQESEPAAPTAATSADPQLAAAAGTLLAAALFLPDTFQNTISFSSRWLAPGLAFALVAVPSPVGPGRLLSRASLGFALAVSLFVGGSWAQFEGEELAGLQPSLQHIDKSSRVVGLDYRQTSELFRDRPFMQMFGYAQVVEDVELNFSFADFPVFPVVYDPPRDKPWPAGLEWFPRRAEPDDLRHFDFALVNASPELHRSFSIHYPVAPVTTDGYWRLYRIEERAP